MVFSSLLAVVLAFSTPCATEDSTNCRWDAETQGNGLGTSFVTVGDGGAQTYYYETGVNTSSRF